MEEAIWELHRKGLNSGEIARELKIYSAWVVKVIDRVEKKKSAHK